MPKLKFQAQAIKGAKCEPGKSKTEFKIENVDNLYLIAFKGGSKRWYCRYGKRVGGKYKQHSIPLGSLNELSPREARSKCRRYLSDIAAGANPSV